MQIYRGFSTQTKIISRQLILMLGIVAATLLLIVAALLAFKSPQVAKAITPPDSCFAFDAAVGRIMDYGDVITNTAEPNGANSRTRGTCPTDLDIPGTIGGVEVLAIGDGAFSGDSLTSVSIPGSVTLIAGSAFRSNQLADITIPESVTYIGTHSFRSNKISSISILPATLSIAGSAFRDNQLTALPEYFTRPGITGIPDGTFRENQFTELVVPGNITSIGSYAFNSNKLTSVTLSNNMTSVGGNYTFAYNQIANIVFPESLTSIGGSYTFAYNKLASLDLPDTLVSITNYAFYRNELETLSLPESVRTIGNFAFGDNKLTSVVVAGAPTTVQHSSLSGNPISSITLAGTVYNDDSPTVDPACFAINDGVVTDYYSASLVVLRDSSVLCGRDASIPDSVTSIGDQAFQNKQLISVTIPTSVTSIGPRAFRSNQLTNIAIPGSVVSIGSQAFEANQLVSLEIPSNVVSIGSSAFRTNKLESVTILDAPVTLGGSAFSGNVISDLDLGDSIVSIAGNSFENNSLTTLSIPNSVSEVGGSAFRNNKIADLNIGNSVLTIGSHAFYNNKLTSLTIPDSVLSIGDSAFTYNQLENLQLGGALNSIGYHAFGNNRLSSVVIPDSVTSLGRYAFSENQLTSVTLGRGLTTIESGAFQANKIVDIYLPNNITSVDPTAFFEQNPLGNLIYSSSSELYRWSDDPSIIQSIYDSIWYTRVYTEDPSNPNNIQPGVASEYWWSWDDNNNGQTQDSLGGHIVNPATIKINYKSGSNQELKASAISRGQNVDGSYIPTHLAKDNLFAVPLDPYSPTPEEQEAFGVAMAKYHYLGDAVTLTPPAIPGYLTPATKTITLTSTDNEVDFVYQPEVKSVSFANPNTLSGSDGSTVASSIPTTNQLSNPLITSSAFAIDEEEVGCSTIQSSSLLAPTAAIASQAPGDITILGGLDFTLSQCVNQVDADAPAQVGVIYTLGSSLPADNSISSVRVYKHSPANDTVTDITSQVSITLEEDTDRPAISYELVDGSEWDEDGEVNGTIVDPIYVGIADYTDAGGAELASTGQGGMLVMFVSLSLLASGVVFVRLGGRA